MKFKEKEYELTSSKIKKEIKFVLFSDLHKCEKYNLEKDSYLLGYVKEVQPDAILIPGDIIDDSDISIEEQDKVLEFLNKLSKTNEKKKAIKILISLGNHDIMTQNKELCQEKSETKWGEYINREWLKRLRNNENIILLDNIPYYDEELNINYKGYTLPVSYFEKTKEDKESLTNVANYINTYMMPYNRPDAFNISLFHASNSLLDNQVLEDTNTIKNCDLMVSGHMHGGVLHLGRIGAISPVKKLFPKYVSGKIDKTSPTGEKMTAIITTGVSKLNIPAVDKILKPEVVKIMVKTKK